MPTYGGEDGDDDDDDDGGGGGGGVSAAVGWRDVGASSATFAGGGRNGWTFANLLSRFGDVAFRLSDGHGEMLPLSTYARYVSGPEGLSDDSPLGIYDSEFGDDGASSPTRALAGEYVVPRCFGPDLFDLADDGDDDDDDDDYDGGGSEDAGRPSRTPRRPPYRWILIGPERSGTGMHVDPLWTSAWVTVLQGRKRWLLFPPETPANSSAWSRARHRSRRRFGSAITTMRSRRPRGRRCTARRRWSSIRGRRCTFPPVGLTWS